MADRARQNLLWLAGLLEGEGCFQNRSDRYCSPLIQLVMADKDVVIRAADIMGRHKVIRVKKDSRGDKRLYRTNLYGQAAIKLMRRLYPIMGSRRQEKISEILNAYWSRPKSEYPERKPYSRGAEIVWLRSG